MRPRKLIRASALTAVILLGGCATSNRGPVSKQGRGGNPVDALRQRAGTLWAAKQNKNWSVAFSFEDPKIRDKSNEAEFVTWSEENEPFVVHSHTIGRVDVEKDMGWVEVNYSSTIRRFPNVPPREATQWQKWRLVDSTWYPVPPKELKYYPEPPSKRDLAGEARVRERFAEAWQFRKTNDWENYYQFFDPRDRGGFSPEALEEAEAMTTAEAYDVKWIEAMGAHAKVHVVYTRRVADKNLTKLPTVRSIENEDWVKVEGEWYRDLKR